MSAYSKTGFFTKLVGVTFDNDNGSSRQQFIEDLYDIFDINNKTSPVFPNPSICLEKVLE